MATWYKDVQPYWNYRHNDSNDGISVEQQAPDSTSLLNYYRKLLQFRSSHSAFTGGKIEVIPSGHDNVLTYCRWDEDSWFLLAFNFENRKVSTTIDPATLPFPISKASLTMAFGDGHSSFNHSDTVLSVTLKEDGYLILTRK